MQRNACHPGLDPGSMRLSQEAMPYGLRVKPAMTWLWEEAALRRAAEVRKGAAGSRPCPRQGA